ncbi:MAG TPA: endolytic transglycosylase MltG [Actinomycetota bacterium]
MVQTPTADVDERSEGRHRRPPHWGLRLGLAFLIVAGLVVAAGVRYYAWCGDASGPRDPVSFTVSEGVSGNQIVDALHRQGVIRCGEVSKWLLRRSGKADAIRAGTYALTTNMTPDAAFTTLTKAPPPVPTVDLTIPEGFRLTQIADRVQQVLHIGARRFLHAADAGAWSLPPYLPNDKPLEGFLFPNTYEFRKRGTTPDEVITKLLDEFRTEAASLPWQDADKLGVTPYQAVTIASMIEEEARIEKDRPLIAAVIYNRLAKGMALGIDATVQYIDPDPSNGLTASDFQIDSPYNTRLHTGLPPTPIASPGLASLRAALDPADVPYLYYVLCGADGHHAFSVTYQRFLQDKARCLG